ncbi:hypothetical protein AVEN_260951-1 [Araneus ventricosus]|uniref:Uncharacterized protein n=1 Tax=Araneus ventricosus TaxID=182803 RepID=A0A4Y2KGF0_ARAVE|nr:hypothetical protein AVEN_260951-1 [Araneus ventricosus]
MISRRTIGKRMLTEKEILQMLQNVSETDSGTNEKYDLSQDVYIPDDENEPPSLHTNVLQKLHERSCPLNLKTKKFIDKHRFRHASTSRETSRRQGIGSQTRYKK